MFNLYVLGELERGVKLQQQKSKKTDFGWAPMKICGIYLCFCNWSFSLPLIPNLL